MIFKKKLEATFGSDFAMEKAEERLLKMGLKSERKPPIKLIIYVKKKEEIEKVRRIVSESLGYLEPIETFRDKLIVKLSAILYFVLRRSKKK